MREVLTELKEWTAGGEQVALATVVETWGSSPRPLGSKMVVTGSGKMAGSVSNGCIEGDVFEEASGSIGPRRWACRSASVSRPVRRSSAP